MRRAEVLALFPVVALATFGLCDGGLTYRIGAAILFFVCGLAVGVRVKHRAPHRSRQTDRGMLVATVHELGNTATVAASAVDRLLRDEEGAAPTDHLARLRRVELCLERIADWNRDLKRHLGVG